MSHSHSVIAPREGRYKFVNGNSMTLIRLYKKYPDNITKSFRFRYHLLRAFLVACTCCLIVTTAAADAQHDTTDAVTEINPSSPSTTNVNDNNNNHNRHKTFSPVVSRAKFSSKVHGKSTYADDGRQQEPFTPLQDVPSQILTLAGTQRPICRTILQSVTPKQENSLRVIQKSIQSMIHLEDITLLVFLATMMVPIGQSLYEWLPSMVPQLTNHNSVEYRKSIYFELTDHTQQIARIALAIYCSDIIKLIIVGLGYTIPGMIFSSEEGTTTTTTTTSSAITTNTQQHHAFGHIAYTIWIANRIGYITRKLLRRYINAHPQSFGRINLIQKWIDAIRYAATVLLILHILRVESGVAINRSFLAVGSVGTLAFGLASQGIATQVINGLLLASSDRIYEGDDVMLGSNGFAGNIVKLGWLETVIRGR
jgi:small-conductance mechanosensitive channel